MYKIDIRIIGLGYKAKHGKDTVANYLLTKFNDSDYNKIFHFADPLKEELKNKKRLCPLVIKLKRQNGQHFYLIQDYRIDRDGQYSPIFHLYNEGLFDNLDDLFKKRNITEYWGMDGDGFDDFKDGEMLQFWGTEYRRNIFSQNYWVNIVKNDIDFYIKSSIESNVKLYPEEDYMCINIIIPDVRFLNEISFLENYIYTYPGVDINMHNFIINVVRVDENGNSYVDPSRSENHSSESELDSYQFTHSIISQTGVDILHKVTDNIVETHNNLFIEYDF